MKGLLVEACFIDLLGLGIFGFFCSPIFVQFDVFRRYFSQNLPPNGTLPESPNQQDFDQSLRSNLEYVRYSYSNIPQCHILYFIRMHF